MFFDNFIKLFSGGLFKCLLTQTSAQGLEIELSDIDNNSISLTPLFKSIEKMRTAAIQINKEIKVITFFIMKAGIIFIL